MDINLTNHMENSNRTKTIITIKTIVNTTILNNTLFYYFMKSMKV